MHGECMEMNVETGLINLLQRESSEILKVLPRQSGKTQLSHCTYNSHPLCSNPYWQLQQQAFLAGNI